MKLLGGHAVDAREECRLMVLFQTDIAKPSIIANLSTVYSQKQNALNEGGIPDARQWKAQGMAHKYDEADRPFSRGFSR